MSEEMTEVEGIETLAVNNRNIREVVKAVFITSQSEQ
jgi:hypothetical protein